MLKRFRSPLFDDQSRYVDRFGLLLVATIIGLAVQSLVDTRTSSGTAETNFGTLLLSGFVGLTFVLALRAAGVANFWRRIADLIVLVGLLTLLVIVCARLHDSLVTFIALLVGQLILTRSTEDSKD